MSSGGLPSRSNEVKNGRNKRENQQQVNEKAGGVEHDETANPGSEKHQTNHEKHEVPFLPIHGDD
jgi:hypothetical protein